MTTIIIVLSEELIGPHAEATSAPPSDVVFPVGHAWQVSDDVAPVAELYRPATQSVQISEDTAAEVDEYFPASQSSQSLKPLYEPGLQSTQSDTENPPFELCPAAGHWYAHEYEYFEPSIVPIVSKADPVA